MTTTDTRDIEGTVAQVKRCADMGADLVRLTVQGKKEAEAVVEIRRRLTEVRSNFLLYVNVARATSDECTLASLRPCNVDLVHRNCGEIQTGPVAESGDAIGHIIIADAHLIISSTNNDDDNNNNNNSHSTLDFFHTGALASFNNSLLRSSQHQDFLTHTSYIAVSINASASFLAEISAKSPRKIFIFII